jgi:hypothetical protein
MLIKALAGLSVTGSRALFFGRLRDVRWKIAEVLAPDLMLLRSGAVPRMCQIAIPSGYSRSVQCIHCMHQHGQT